MGDTSSGRVPLGLECALVRSQPDGCGLGEGNRRPSPHEIAGASQLQNKVRVSNWPSCERALARRGDVALWIGPAAIAAWTDGSDEPGNQPRYSDGHHASAAVPPSVAADRRILAFDLLHDAPHGVARAGPHHAVAARATLEACAPAGPAKRAHSALRRQQGLDHGRRRRVDDCEARRTRQTAAAEAPPWRRRRRSDHGSQMFVMRYSCTYPRLAASELIARRAGTMCA